MHLIIDLLLQLHIPQNGKCYVSFFQLIKGHDGETLPLCIECLNLIDIIEHKIREYHILLACKDTHLHEFCPVAHKFKLHIFTVIFMRKWCG